MPKRTSPNDYELRDEYDLSKMTIVPKGRYAPERRAGKNVVLLAPDIARAFPTDETVNDALRLVLQIAKMPRKRKAKNARTSRPRATASPGVAARTAA
jgi:hypothetical protein